jgi:hypothetical protein
MCGKQKVKNKPFAKIDDPTSAENDQYEVKFLPEVTLSAPICVWCGVGGVIVS